MCLSYIRTVLSKLYHNNSYLFIFLEYTDHYMYIIGNLLFFNGSH